MAPVAFLKGFKGVHPNLLWEEARIVSYYHVLCELLQVPVKPLQYSELCLNFTPALQTKLLSAMCGHVRSSTSKSTSKSGQRMPEVPTKTTVPAEVVLLVEQLNDSPVTAQQVATWTRQNLTLAKVLAGRTVFSELNRYGLTEDILQTVFLQSYEGNTLSWKVEPIGFYRELYNYLCKWPQSKSATKSSIGKFFVSIDPNFQHRISDRPSNVYMYVQRLAMSSKPHSEPMLYGIEKTVVKEYQSSLQEMSDTAQEQQKDLQAMNIQLKIAQASSRKELANVSNKLAVQRGSSQKKVQKNKKILEAAIIDASHYEDVLLSENKELSELINQLKKEITTLSGSNVTLVSDTDSDKV